MTQGHYHHGQHGHHSRPGIQVPEIPPPWRLLGRLLGWSAVIMLVLFMLMFLLALLGIPI